MTSKVKKAAEANIPVVREEFIDDCIKNGKPIEVFPYVIPIGPE